MSNYKSNLPAVKKAMEAAKRKTLEAIGLYVTSETTIRTPVDTGELRGSYRHQVNEDSVSVGTSVDYGPYVELGTHKMDAKPHLRPAAEDNLQNIKRLAEGEYRL